jgi:hypothetical protein
VRISWRVSIPFGHVAPLAGAAAISTTAIRSQ